VDGKDITTLANSAGSGWNGKPELVFQFRGQTTLVSVVQSHVEGGQALQANATSDSGPPRTPTSCLAVISPFHAVTCSIHRWDPSCGAESPNQGQDRRRVLGATLMLLQKVLRHGDAAGDGGIHSTWSEPSGRP